MRILRTPPRLAPRPRDAHKASVGRVLVVGGSRGMAGAPALAALGALRSGAGLVRIAVPRSIQDVVATIRPEATTADLPETRGGSLAPNAKPYIHALLESWDALVLGPGAARETPTRRLLASVAASATKPMVLDADGLYALGNQPEQLEEREVHAVLTPHEGEAGRLLGTASSDVRADRRGAARELAKRSGNLVVLKGPGTLVTDGTRMFQARTGGPWLATGGSGDVLSGVVGAFLAGLPDTGGDAFGAACAAVHVHGAASDHAARGLDRGILATDVANALPRQVAALIRKDTRKRRSP